MKRLLDANALMTQWVLQELPAAVAGNVSFTGTDLYSFKQLVGRMLPDGSAALATHHWSPTTDRHLALASRMCWVTSTTVHRIDKIVPPEQALSTALAQFKELKAKADNPRIRDTTRLLLERDMRGIVTNVNGYCAALGFDGGLPFPDD